MLQGLPHREESPRTDRCGRAWSVACVLALAACWLSCSRPPHFMANMQSVNPEDRIMAIRAAVERGDQAAVPHIVDRLEDEDDGVRFFAILALDRMTGERFGYDYAKPATQRAAAVNRWRAYVRGPRDVPAAGDQRADARGGGGAPAASPTGEKTP